MNDLSTVINFALIVAAVVSVGGVGYLRGTITNLRGQLADADREIRVLKDKQADDRATMATQAADISALQRIVTGEKHLVAILEAIAKLRADAETHWEREEEMHSDVIGALVKMHTALVAFGTGGVK